MAGRAFKGWGLFLHGFNRGFNPNALTAGMERGFAKKQRDDDVARAGAWREEDIRRQDAAKVEAGNRALFGTLSPDEQVAALARDERPETFTGSPELWGGVLTARRKAKEAAAAAAAEASKQKLQGEMEKAKIAASPAHGRNIQRKREKLGEELIAVTNGDYEAAKALRRRDPRYHGAILPPRPKDGRGAAVQHPVDLGRSARLQGWISRLEGLGTQGFSEQYPIVKQVLQHYRSNSPRRLIVGPDINEQIDNLHRLSPEAADALSFVIGELAAQDRATLTGTP